MATIILNPMKGTVKQCKWANTIRKGFLNDTRKVMPELFNAIVDSTFDAAFWIDNRDTDLNTLQQLMK